MLRGNRVVPRGTATGYSAGVPGIALAFCTTDRPLPLADALRDAVAQLPADGEIVVIDQSATEPLAQNASMIAALGDPRVRHLHQAERSLPRARNLAIATTSAPILVFFDDDVRIHPGCLAAHATAFADERIGGVVGRIVETRVRPNSAATRNEVDAWGRVRTRLDGTAPQRIGSLKGANMSFRRSALVAAGGFDENYGGTAFLEDADASEAVVRRGLQLWFVPSAEVTHLSHPEGGVRQPDARATERWRFRNTGYFLAKHRPGSLSRARLTFAAIAARRSAEWRDPLAVPALLRQFERGVQLAQQRR